jgi:hypothetical protein
MDRRSTCGPGNAGSKLDEKGKVWFGKDEIAKRTQLSHLKTMRSLFGGEYIYDTEGFVIS